MATSAQRSSSWTRRGRHRRGGDADADADVQPDALDGERLRAAGRAAARPAPRASSRLGVGQQDGELVAAEPGQHVVRAAARCRSRGPTWRSRSSPAWWPRLSLTSLNPSRSSSSRAAGRPGAAVREHRAGRARAAPRRLGSPVSSSVRACSLDLVERADLAEGDARCGRAAASTQPTAQPGGDGRAAGRPSRRRARRRLATLQASGTASSRQPTRDAGRERSTGGRRLGRARAASARSGRCRRARSGPAGRRRRSCPGRCRSRKTMSPTRSQRPAPRRGAAACGRRAAPRMAPTATSRASSSTSATG